MQVQTIPKSPPKIIVQVAEKCDFFFARIAEAGARAEAGSIATVEQLCQ